MYINQIINYCKNQLLKDQKNDGHWVYELEADTTIPAEYILMNHFLVLMKKNQKKN